MPAKFEETTLQIFPDLAAETLTRRRILKPLLKHLKMYKIQYSWGFQACLIAQKKGRSTTLRFPEDMAKFCKRLDIPMVEIPGWWEPQEKMANIEGWGPSLIQYKCSSNSHWLIEFSVRPLYRATKYN